MYLQAHKTMASLLSACSDRVATNNDLLEGVFFFFFVRRGMSVTNGVVARGVIRCVVIRRMLRTV